MHRLSSPLDSLAEHYDVVVVGSGYGGGVAASRFARAGRSVCVLERGRERLPGEYPATLHDAATEVQVDTAEGHAGSDTALFDFRVNADLNVLVGCGLGGTSLINANVSLPPDPRVFDDRCWPAAFQADRATLLEDSFAHARQMLRPTAYPEDWPRLAKLQAHERSALGMGQPFTRVPINVTFADGLNHVGVEQRRCSLCGDCVTGCNDSAKNTTLMNYLPDAWNHGAQMFTETLVRHVERRGAQWAVYFRAIAPGRERFGETLLSVAADVVVLAAGALGSTEILLRSRERGLPLSLRLGERFTGNGDVLGFAHSTRDLIHGIGTHPRPADDAPVGPCITSVIDMRNHADVERGLVIEEGSVPAAIAPLLAVPLAAAGLHRAGTGLVERARTMGAEADSVAGALPTDAVARAQTFLVMSHDDSDGCLRLQDDRIRVDWPGVCDKPVFAGVGAHLAAAAEALGGIFAPNPLWSDCLGHNLITVHPLGGCAMGEHAQAGVVNHKCQVYAGERGAAVHDGLYVMDGAVMPRSLGVNPLLTITAVAERAAALLARDREWTIDYRLPSSPKHRAENAVARMGLEFTERMVGELNGSHFDFVLTVASADLDRMLADPEHPATLYGIVHAPSLSPQPLSVQDGRFNLFVEHDDEIHTHRMRYRARMRAADGRVFFLDGFKAIRDGSLLEVWPATTTLTIAVHDGADESAPVIGRGTLRIKPADFGRQLTTMQVRNAPDTVTRARALGAFGRLFAGTLWEHFGGALATNPPAGERAVMREKRPLRAPLPEVHFLAAADGVELRLVRYRGGAKGPFICAPGFSNTSQVFAWDGIDTNWVEYFTAHEYDVWLFDYRASPDLPASRTQFTLDEVALNDWPAAVDYVRRETGADSVQALGHCLGSATGFMGLLSGRLHGIRQFVGSQVMPFIDVSRMSKLKAATYVDTLVARLGISEVTTKRGRTLHEKAVDEALRVVPMPSEWQALGPVCRRIYAIYGPVMNPAQLNRETRDALEWIFGYGNLTSFAHISQFIRHDRIVDAHGDDVYMPHVDRLTPHIVLMQGLENALFLPRGSEDTLNWIRDHHGPDACTRLIFPEYAHLDCFIGRDAARDVFPAVLRELDAHN